MIATTVGVNLPSTLVFDYPSVLTLAEHVHHLLDDLYSSDMAQRHSISQIPSQHVAHERFVKVCLMEYALTLRHNAIK